MRIEARHIIFAIFFAAAGFAFLFAVLSWDRPLALGFEKVTGLDVSYSRWAGNPFGKSVVYSPEFRSKELGGGLSAGLLRLSLDASRLLSDREIMVECVMRDVRLFLFSEGDGEAKTLLELVASSDEGLGETFFVLAAGRDVLRVTSLRAMSDDFEVSGNFFWERAGNTVSVEIDIFISPEAAVGLAEGIRTRVLTPREDGWYGTSLNYRGDPTFLKALYLTFSPGRT